MKRNKTRRGFVELIKKNIHMNKLKCKSNVQLTLDDDFNVPDIKPDIEKIIKEQGEIVVTEIKPMSEKLMVKGNLRFNLLYLSEDDSQPIHNIMGELPFDEMVNMDDTCSGDNITVKWELDDLSTNLINSRKISVKAIVSFVFAAEDIYDEETAVFFEGEESVCQQSRKMNITQIALSKKDTFRVKDEVRLPPGKANIYNILYNELGLRGVDFRVGENQINLKGELQAFILYVQENGNGNIQYFETEVPFSGVIECAGCSEDMVLAISAAVPGKEIQVKPDDDGEERIIDIEAVLDLDMKVYAEEEVEILSDVYSTSMELTPVMKDAYFENLVLKNNNKIRIVDRIPIDSGQPKVLQICNASGNVRIDDQYMVTDGIQVQGIIEVQILYIAEEDNKPIGSIKGVIPFSQTIEVKGIKEESIFTIKGELEQINVMMLDGEEVEVKANIGLDTMVFDKIKTSIITDVKVEDLDLEKLQKMPSIIGYIVKQEDSLWKIAKNFYTTVERIKELNEMDTEYLKTGDKLLLMKEVDTIL